MGFEKGREYLYLEIPNLFILFQAPAQSLVAEFRYFETAFDALLISRSIDLDVSLNLPN